MHQTNTSTLYPSQIFTTRLLLFYCAISQFIFTIEEIKPCKQFGTYNTLLHVSLLIWVAREALTSLVFVQEILHSAVIVFAIANFPNYHKFSSGGSCYMLQNVLSCMQDKTSLIKVNARQQKILTFLTLFISFS